jgi:hypothetical protein
MDLKQAIRASLKNIAAHGDTDIFPFPFETHVFFDRLDDCCTLLAPPPRMSGGRSSVEVFQELVDFVCTRDIQIDTAF